MLSPLFIHFFQLSTAQSKSSLCAIKLYWTTTRRTFAGVITRSHQRTGEHDNIAQQNVRQYISSSRNPPLIIMDSSVANEGGERHKLAEGYSRRQKSPPRQPRNFRPTPSRSPSPLPLPSEPLPEYLAIAFQTPSVMAQSATRRDGQHRKLLILDLNGTLLVRTTRGTPYPRPFMPNFRDYLFHKETRKWLDVMVWSSAQPFNVDKMVRRCFFSSSSNTSLHGAEPAPVATGDEWEGKLLAVWARDTLGLSSHAYGMCASRRPIYVTHFVLNLNLPTFHSPLAMHVCLAIIGTDCFISLTF